MTGSDRNFMRSRVPTGWGFTQLVLRILLLLLNLAILAFLFYISATWQKFYAGSYFIVSLKINKKICGKLSNIDGRPSSPLPSILPR